MTDKYCMRFVLYTLIDITQTNARRGEDPFAHQQQQNYMTALQTISLRANPIITTSPVCKKMTCNELGFEFKGKHNVWSLEFSFESEGQHSLDFLNLDFNYVPVIKELNETIELNPCAFITHNGNSNTKFIQYA